MKKITCILFLVMMIVSCKTQSNIVTSKEEAKEKGLYSYTGKNNSKTSNSSKDNTENVASNRKSDTTPESVSVSKSTFPLANRIVDSALENLGVSYRTGGATKTGMDCSGLVFSTFENYDISLPRTSIDMSRYGEMISTSEAQPGDLIFFTTNGKTVINHVGIIIEVLSDEIKFIHSSTSKGVIVSSTMDAYYGKTFAQINRVLNY